MFLVYNLLLTLAAPIWVPWMLVRSWRRQEKPNWKERTGTYEFKRPEGRVAWIHAVSVGEVIAAKPIIGQLREKDPTLHIVLSVTTSSGHQTAREAGIADSLFYFPIDVARFQLSAMQKVRPNVVAIMETELWMNFLWAAKVFRARTLLINGRISDRSFPKSKRVSFFYGALLSNLDLALMQTATDEERIRTLGAPNADTLGNSKFDQGVLDEMPDRKVWRDELGLSDKDFVIVVGSTRGEMEGPFVLEALHDLPIKIVHAPRHLEGVPDLVHAAEKLGYTVALRSRQEAGAYLILDTYGELANAYAAADLAIVGGGFDNLGGQNLIQPLALGIPVVHGPHMQNFKAVAEAADSARATVTVKTSAELREVVQMLIDRPDLREAMGTAGRELVRAGQGASLRYAEAIIEASRDKHPD
jgi:3-deoxy-D-manno-octulosonic-acid transferase